MYRCKDYSSKKNNNFGCCQFFILFYLFIYLYFFCKGCCKFLLGTIIISYNASLVLSKCLIHMWYVIFFCRVFQYVGYISFIITSRVFKNTSCHDAVSWRGGGALPSGKATTVGVTRYGGGTGLVLGGDRGVRREFLRSKASLIVFWDRSTTRRRRIVASIWAASECWGLESEGGNACLRRASRWFEAVILKLRGAGYVGKGRSCLVEKSGSSSLNGDGGGARSAAEVMGGWLFLDGQC
ncbi:hypothetical protein RchiOBHm_Chr3g0481301 [Rosa chinensis]|uniref:Uncharacterized protein n=1 Tax=Rosa chinensis TaxID=74649 RepID=A0A2P6RDW2_ROSCH|nr:hypothetical protein RchiOBHm_Chr3g0481301 [Rosa chinensis]